MLTQLRNRYKLLNSDIRFSEILTGSVWSLSARIVGTLFALTTSVIVARFYGSEMVGIMAMLQAFLMFISIFILMGTDTAIIRLISEHIAKYSIRSAFKVYRKTQCVVVVWGILISVLFIVEAGLVAEKFFDKAHLSFYFAMAAGFAIFKVLADLNTQAVRGLRLIRTFSIMQAMPQGIMLLLMLLALSSWNRPDAPVYAQLGTLALTALAGIWIINRSFRRQINPGDEIYALAVKDILRVSSPMMITSLMVFFSTQTGVVLLGVFATEQETGYYAIAVKLATLMTFALSAINSMVAPKFAELFHAKKIDDLFHVAHKSARLIFWTTAPLLAILLVLGNPILERAFGEEFTIAYPTLTVLVVGQFINTASGSTAIFMNMTGQQKVFSRIMVAGAGLNVLLGLLLIPALGAVGAALAASCSLAFWNVITLSYIKARHGRCFGYLPVPSYPFRVE